MGFQRSTQEREITKNCLPQGVTYNREKRQLTSTVNLSLQIAALNSIPEDGKNKQGSISAVLSTISTGFKSIR
jgi:hypothetical protein